MKAFPFNNWLQESWKRDGRAPHLFVELMDGTIEHSAIKAEDMEGVCGLETYIDLEGKIIKRALIVYPPRNSPSDPCGISQILDGKTFNFIANVDTENKLCDVLRWEGKVKHPDVWQTLENFLARCTTAKIQYAGNIPPQGNL